jgi:hypothetical protein
MMGTSWSSPREDEEGWGNREVTGRPAYSAWNLRAMETSYRSEVLYPRLCSGYLLSYLTKSPHEVDIVSLH